MYYGKQLCAALKQVRSQIAAANGIPYQVPECDHQGDCSGTCPQCDAEVRYIQNQLDLRRAAGIAVTVAGLSLGIASSFSSCASHLRPEVVGRVSGERNWVDEHPSSPDASATEAQSSSPEAAPDGTVMDDDQLLPGS